ncbi:hypothetical protein PAL_GLEAN10004755 [Pteropus alecto]|uniref:Uncharacterized protein n=1 Tax=Pteropus alecto TaxID=9402 RepID=L5KCH6_PTEAL|nr:hypothetical protein PAL_GLEAN10004755 [Pteropus alecto]
MELKAAYPFGKCFPLKAESETMMTSETRVCGAHVSILLLLLYLRQSPRRHCAHSLCSLRGCLSKARPWLALQPPCHLEMMKSLVRGAHCETRSWWKAYASAKGCYGADRALWENAQQHRHISEVRLSSGRRAEQGQLSVQRRFRIRRAPDTQRGRAKGSFCRPTSSTLGYVSTIQSLILKILNAEPIEGRWDAGGTTHRRRQPHSQSVLHELHQSGAVTISKGLRL